MALTPTSLPTGIYESQGESFISAMLSGADAERFSQTSETKDRADFQKYQESLRKASAEGGLKGLAVSLILGFILPAPLKFLKPVLNFALPMMGSKNQMNKIESPNVFPNAGKSVQDSLDAHSMGKSLQYAMYATQFQNLMGGLPTSSSNYETILQGVNDNLIASGQEVLTESQEQLLQAFVKKQSREGVNLIVQESWKQAVPPESIIGDGASILQDGQLIEGISTEEAVGLDTNIFPDDEPFNPLGKGYDDKTAFKYNMNELKDATGHMPSRVPDGPEEGLLLKGIDHPTFGDTVTEELKLGNKVFMNKETGRVYSFTTKQWNEILAQGLENKYREWGDPSALLNSMTGLPEEGGGYKLPGWRY